MRRNTIPVGNAIWHSPSSLALNPSGESLLAISGQGVSFYSRNVTSGELDWVGHAVGWQPFLNYRMDMDLSPQGGLVFVSNPALDRLDIFEICEQDPQ